VTLLSIRLPSVLAALAACSLVPAQNWFVPDNIATAGTCSVIPFGSVIGSSFTNVLYQQRCTAGELGAAANLITGLGFAACSTSRAHYDSIEIVIDHIPPSQALSTTFAANLTPAAQVVLTASNYTWNLTGDAWNEIGLQTPFVFNGVDDIVVQITTVGGTNLVGTGPASGFHRGNRQRIHWAALAGTPPATGTSSNVASKIEVSMLMARTSSHGDGCAGSNGVPTLTPNGTAQQGTTMGFDFANGVPSGVAVFLAGLTNAAPYPIELGFLGAPGCYAYTDLVVTDVAVLDPTGAGSYSIPIPAALVGFRFFGQFAVLDPAANPFGFTTSNYLNVHTGN
jgi:hypothetical protein